MRKQWGNSLMRAAILLMASVDELMDFATSVQERTILT